MSPRLVGQSVARSTANATASVGIKFQQVGRAASEPVRHSRVSANPALQAYEVAGPNDPDLAFGYRPPGVVVGRFEGVRQGCLSTASC